MQELKLQAHAKINLGLDVLRRRPDGYHDLRMIMQTVNVFDEITLKRVREPGIRLTTNVPDLPVDSKNLAYRAAALLQEAFPQGAGVLIDIQKTIPMAAGLAGGSSDAAAVLLGLNRLFDLGLSQKELMVRGKTLGADVPFCILGGTALAEGIGEILTPLSAPPALHVLLAKPPVQVSTKYVYTNVRLDANTRHPDIDGQIAALLAGDPKGLCACMGNLLESVTIPVCPAIDEIKEVMRVHGCAGCLMSGSGPTVFGLFSAEEAAQAAADAIREAALANEIFVTEFYPGAGAAHDE